MPLPSKVTNQTTPVQVMEVKLKPGDAIRFGSFERTFGMAKILKVDEALSDLPTPEPVYHLLIYSLRSIIPPNESHFLHAKPFISHLPILSTPFMSSIPEKISESTVLEEELAAYSVWREAFFNGNAGIFDIPIPEAVALIVESLRLEKWE